MKVLILGGTNFIGPSVIRYLHRMNHDITVFHRGKTQADLPTAIKIIQGDRANLIDFQAEFQKIAPDVVLDMFPYTEHDAKQVIQVFQRVAQRVVAISSQDVYRAYDVLRKLEADTIDPVPLTEDSPLRTRFYPFKDLPETPLGKATDYEKILVEKVLMNNSDLPATILRLPMVYGAHDPLRRIYPYLQRMDAKRPAIVLEESIAHWRGSYGYVGNVAWAIALAVTDARATGRIYNIAEPALTEVERIHAIAQLAEWQGEVVIVPRAQMPAGWDFVLNPQQDWWIDTTRIRTELGYAEPFDQNEALRQTIAWERANPVDDVPQWAAPQLLDIATEDKILSTRLSKIA